MENQQPQTTPNVETAPPPLPTVQKRNRKTIILVIVCGLLLLTALSSIGLFAMSQKKQPIITTQPSPTISSAANMSIQNISPQAENPTPTIVLNHPTTASGWKMYTNTKYGYSFEYPPAFHQTSTGCTGPDRTMCYDSQQFGVTEYNEGETLDIYVGKTAGGISSLDELLNQNSPSNEYYRFLKRIKSNDLDILLFITKKGITVGNNAAYPHQEVVAQFLESEKETMYIVTYSWPVQDLNAPPTADQIDKYTGLLAKVLSSFTTKK